MKSRSRIITYILIICALTARAQNVWIENRSEQIDDSLHFRIFDPYAYSSFDTIHLLFGDGTDESLIMDSTNNIDTLLFHPYPGPGSYKRSFQSEGFQLIGMNVQSNNTSYYFEQTISYNTISFFYFHDSPLFDLNYELVRCKDEPFYVNTLLYEINGDSLHFDLSEIDGHLSIPEGVEMNTLTGEISWFNEPDTGLYHFILQLTEWRQWDQQMGSHMARFSIKVTDSCQTIVARDNIDNENLFEVQGREFIVPTTVLWDYSFRIAKSDWDSISVRPSSEIFEHSFFDSHYSVTDIGDSLEMTVSWMTDSIHKRNHPYIITYHVTAFKNGNTHHRILTNAIYVDWPLGMNTPSQGDGHFSIHPNPTTGRVTIIATSDIKRIELLNTSGLKVEDYEIPGTSSSDIELKAIPNGLYFLRIRTEKETVTTRIVKTTN